jgi:hypothetical protein
MLHLPVWMMVLGGGIWSLRRRSTAGRTKCAVVPGHFLRSDGLNGVRRLDHQWMEQIKGSGNDSVDASMTVDLG